MVSTRNPHTPFDQFLNYPIPRQIGCQARMSHCIMHRQCRCPAPSPSGVVSNFRVCWKHCTINVAFAKESRFPVFTSVFANGEGVLCLSYTGSDSTPIDHSRTQISEDSRCDTALGSIALCAPRLCLAVRCF